MTTISLLVGLLILTWAHTAISQETQASRYNLGIIGMAPYAMADKDGLYSGYMVEMGQKIREASGFTGMDDVLPLKRLHGLIKNGSVDCTFLARVTLTEGAYTMLTPIGKIIQSVIIPKAGIKLSSYNDLKGLIIGVPTGVTLDKRFHEDGTLEKLETSGYLQSTKMLQLGRIDAMIGVWDSYLFNMRELGMSRDDIGPPLILNEVPIWLMCRPDFDNEAVKSRLVHVVNKLRDQGVFKSIIAKYIGNVQ